MFLLLCYVAGVYSKSCSKPINFLFPSRKNNDRILLRIDPYIFSEHSDCKKSEMQKWCLAKLAA